MRYEKLDTTVRRYMDEEFRNDEQRNRLYFSPRVNEESRETYSQILERALAYGDDNSLAVELKEKSVMKQKERRMNPLGGILEVNMPINAPNELAEGEFQRYYLRALCVKAINEGINRLKIVSEKPIETLPDDQKAKVGKIINPKDLLADLRENSYVNSRFGIPDPKAGLTVEFLQ